MKRTKLIPAVVFLLQVIAVLWIRQLNEDSHLRNIRNSSTIVAEQLAVRLEAFFAHRFAIGEHIRHEWNEGNIRTPENFLSQTKSFQQLFPDFQAINWADKDGVIKWVTPLQGNQGAIGLDLKAHPVVGPVLAKVEINHKIGLTRPLELAQGGTGIAAYIPLGSDQNKEGYINLVFRISPLVKAALEHELDHTYHYQITDDETPVFSQGEVDMASPLTVRRTFGVANRQWTIALMPTALALEDMSLLASNLTVLLALAISSVLAWLLWLYLKHQEELVSKTNVLEAVLENMDEGISMADADLNLIAFNRRFLDLLNFPPEKFKVGDSFESFIRFNAERGEYGEGDVDEQIRGRVELAKKFSAHHFERTMPDGTVLQIHGIPMPGGGFVTSYTDISERKWAEKELKRSEERFSKAFNSSPACLSIASIQDGLLYDVNDHWCATTGYDRTEVIGKTVAEMGLWQNFRQRAQLVKAIRRDKSIRDFQGTVITKTGEARECIFNGELIDIDNEERLLLVFHDVTELKRAEDRALHLAGHDPLTGLPNRNLMRDRLEQELTRAKRNDTKIAIMFIDLNDFKQVNDRFGHKAGDQVLQSVTARMKECVRASDTLARFGGDEFVIIMPDVLDQTSVIRTCEKLTEALRDSFDLDDTKIHIGASIGITMYPDHAESPEALLEMADKAMYDLKDDDDSVGFKFAEGRN
ncbi:MAG: diguanylate cyclase [Rhodospirillaceae bacterium]|nr:diguanylate cyclase [Rhodospirillaceae bacterium]MBT5245305.1 diguanylate cyclase [Rhodospirillaceae bacterium]MBT5561421.1 diguanylate cyclase [Rhodospirillaceae bacterium]MBT6243326.1 diguanylate cyclase [Rhodospirillaceae bacterium]MBT7137171.1 diguanylate cyclase [Rhodospirillaceae bacterium]